jgi:glycosyltransferase involved in cell wall biosynthesis
MRIGLVTAEYPPDQGGVGDFTTQLGRALAALGHEVHVLTSAPRTTQHATRNTQHVSRLAPHESPIVHRRVHGWGWGCWRQVLALAQELELDVLDVQYQAAAYRMHPAINFIPQRRDRPPVVVTFHDLKVPYLFPKAGPLRWRVVRMLARRAGRVIVTNQEDYLRLEGEVSSARLSLIPIGSNIPPVPPPGYDRDAERARWGVGPRDLLLGYFGFLNESKGGEELVQALAILVERGVPAHLVMIGGRVGTSDPTNRAYAERVRNLIARLSLGERVHWTGYTRPEEVSAALLATDGCVLAYRDGVSFRRGTLHACLGHGRAVVTTRPAVVLPQVRDGENMLLVEPQDPEGIAGAVARLTTDDSATPPEFPGLRARLEAGAAALAAEFTWERIARRTAALFRRL